MDGLGRLKLLGQMLLLERVVAVSILGCFACWVLCLSYRISWKELKENVMDPCSKGQVLRSIMWDHAGDSISLSLPSLVGYFHGEFRITVVSSAFMCFTRKL